MKHSISLSQAIGLYISAVLGSGILFLTASTASVAGPASLLAWVFMVLLSFPLAYTFATLSRNYPDAGGAATFVRLAFGKDLGNLVGWFYFITAAVGQIIVSLTGATYIGNAFNLTNTEISLVATAILMIGGISNHYGLRVSGRVSLILSAILIFILLFTIIISIPHIKLDNFSPFFPKGYLNIGVAVIMIFWSFFGWEAICNLVDRFKNPKKNIVKSTLISAAIIGTVFITFSFVTIGTGTYGDYESNLAPIGVMINRSFGIGVQIIMALLAFIVCTGTVNAFVASLSQLGYALSRDKAFPRWFQYKNFKSKAATRVVWAVIIFAIFGVLALLISDLHYDKILFIPNSLGLVVYIISMAAGLKLHQYKTKEWFSALASLIILLICLPFLGVRVLVPTIVGCLYLMYMYFQNEKRSIERTQKEHKVKQR
jgi:amino acid efflux transporter